jgi:hypothetical protein
VQVVHRVGVFDADDSETSDDDDDDDDDDVEEQRGLRGIRSVPLVPLSCRSFLAQFTLPDLVCPSTQGRALVQHWSTAQPDMPPGGCASCLGRQSLMLPAVSSFAAPD